MAKICFQKYLFKFGFLIMPTFLVFLSSVFEKPGFFEEFLGSQICEKASLNTVSAAHEIWITAKNIEKDALQRAFFK